ncbi:ABC transporter permease [Mangrovimonas sp. DI 80]|uniref:ABC transporter permease n=1 Tax=Mangrovimonas sp. DI 80 TaxID=1779330 RepID=UPI000975C9CC|nr:ABC transporter permease [Mangrovimonas sp. DI 80]OMP31799.1 ABC transporter permease [Mangrovimonas sp. DI 80]
MKENSKQDWDIVIEPQSSLFAVDFKSIWRYRDLLKMFVKRDVITIYKQTVLGPIWYVVQPLLTTLMFLVIFNRIARISTDGIPPVLFYLSGVTIWNYFSETFKSTSETFKTNQDIFGKVFFPRLIVPLSKVIGGLIKFVIQFGLFIVVYLYYWLTGQLTVQLNSTLFLFPLLLLLMAGFGMGAGILFTSLTAKYRDLTFLLIFAVQLMMYVSSVIAPFSSVPEAMQTYLFWNPFIHIIEAFRYMFLGSGLFSWFGLAYTTVLMLVVLAVGVLVFNKTEKTFMDTV